MLPIKRYGKWIFRSMIALAIIGYGIFQARGALAGPGIVILTPQNGSTVNSAVVAINGNAQRVTYLSLNNQSIVIDQTGAFSEAFVLAKGYNVLTLSAHDRFGRKTSKTLELIYK